MLVESFPVGALGCNCSIVADLASGEAIVIDPGGDFDAIDRRLRARGLVAKAIVHTHTHIDHVGATAELQRATSAPARIHQEDKFLYDILPLQAQLIGVRPAPATCEFDAWLRDGEVIAIAGIDLHVIHTPGHTPGSCCFEARAKGAAQEATVLFSGDTLFKRSVGRTDLWGGDRDELTSSIRRKLFTLPEPTRVVCGHGPDTTIAAEKRLNPFVGVHAR